MADLTNGLLQGLQQGLGSYLEASERRKDRELRQREMEDASGFRKQNLEAEFFKSGLLPKYDPSGKLIGADVNEPVMKARRDADPAVAAIRQYTLEEAARKARDPYNAMSEPEKVVAKDSASKYSDLATIKDSMDQVVAVLNDPTIDKTQKMKAAQGALKLLNSASLNAPDVVGAEEAKRMGGLLNPSMTNVLPGAGPMFVPDVEGFTKQLETSSAGLAKRAEQLRERAKLPPPQQGLIPQQSQAKTVSPQDQKALDWARKNPQDPRAKAIMQKLGM